MVVSFIDGGNQSTKRKPPTCHKSLTNFITCKNKRKSADQRKTSNISVYIDTTDIVLLFVLHTNSSIFL